MGFAAEQVCEGTVFECATLGCPRCGGTVVMNPLRKRERVNAISVSAIGVMRRAINLIMSTEPCGSTVTDTHLNLALNLFGGIVRWNATPTQQWQIIGNTAPGGESVLWNSATAGGSTGLANAHIIYEPY
jgi:hypothetical protein